MAKDRANDPKRVPSLGISEPISHVSVQPQSAREDWSGKHDYAEDYAAQGGDTYNKSASGTNIGMKRDAFQMTDLWRERSNRETNALAEHKTAQSRKKGTLPVVKIRSDK